MCLRDDLEKLEEAGAVSLKIEGRLKRPEYAAVVADSYRRGLDSLAAGDFRPAGNTEREGLLQIYNRGGFMRGYAFGCEDAGVIDPSSPRHSGVDLGGRRRRTNALPVYGCQRTCTTGTSWLSGGKPPDRT